MKGDQLSKAEQAWDNRHMFWEQNRFPLLHVSDVEFHQLVRTWLVCASCQMPVISKSFELQIQVGGGKGSNKVGFYIVSRLSVDFFHRGRSEGLRRHKTVGLWQQSLKRTARWQFPTNRTNAKCFPVYLTVDCFSAGNRRSRRLLYVVLSSAWI